MPKSPEIGETCPVCQEVDLKFSALIQRQVFSSAQSALYFWYLGQIFVTHIIPDTSDATLTGKLPNGKLGT